MSQLREQLSHWVPSRAEMWSSGVPVEHFLAPARPLSSLPRTCGCRASTTTELTGRKKVQDFNSGRRVFRARVHPRVCGCEHTLARAHLQLLQDHAASQCHVHPHWSVARTACFWDIAGPHPNLLTEALTFPGFSHPSACSPARVNPQERKKRASPRLFQLVRLILCPSYNACVAGRGFVLPQTAQPLTTRPNILVASTFPVCIF